MARSLTIIGGGLAGLAAAEAACRAGMHVELYESRATLGGRAGSLRDPVDGSRRDACQHLALGCCRDFFDFFGRLGLAELLHRHRHLHFVVPGGRTYRFSGVDWLPPPLHLLPSLMRLGFLGWAERWKIVRAAAALVQSGPAESGQTVGPWLAAQGQSKAAVEGFWAPVLVSALGDTLDRIAVSAARQVIVQGFLESVGEPAGDSLPQGRKTWLGRSRDRLLGSRRGYELWVPSVPLAELHQRIATGLRERGVAIHLGRRVRQIDGDHRMVRRIGLADGSSVEPDRVVLAVPWWQVTRLLGPELGSALPEVEPLQAIRPAAITAVHLWFERPITRLPHAVLPGRVAQWLFRPDWEADSGYGQVVISASHALAPWPREAVARRVLDELHATWPKKAGVRLLRWQIVDQRRAVFSCVPGLERLRPGPRSSVPNLFWAGDWTNTGWPATMEGAVRSGRSAVNAAEA